MKSTNLLLVSAFSVLLLMAPRTSAQNWESWVSPGIKLGYVMGDGGGLIGGFEVSITRWRSPYYLGAVASLDFCGKRVMPSVSIEGGTNYVGAAVGPVLSLSDSETEVGAAASLYTGLGIMPYYRMTLMPGDVSRNEVGMFLKFPLQTAGSNFRQGEY